MPKDIHTDFNQKRYLLRTLGTLDAERLQQYRSRNQKHLERWDPTRNEDYFSVQSCRHDLAIQFEQAKTGTGLYWAALDQTQSNIVALCNFTNISYGVFQACHLGYSIDQAQEGRGLMTYLLHIAINEVFKTHNLHRIMANYMPSNLASARVLEKLGFEKEGLAKSYLKIDGQWQDHILTAKINPDH